MRGKIYHTIFLLLFVVILSACSNESADDGVSPAEPAFKDFADIIYYGGDILTMDDAHPTAEAVAVKDGKIFALGNLLQLESKSGKSTRRVNLKGSTLLPGFFDSHSHLAMTAAKMAVVNLDPPPAGPVDSIESMLEALRQHLATQALAENDWLIGWGYDHVMLAEARHPTRKDLDEVSRDIPIMLIHFSGHQVVLNSKGLALSGISASTEDPAGGRILREVGSQEPNGMLQETAMFPVVFPILNKLITGGADIAAGLPPTADALRRVEVALSEYAEQGFTTVTEMGATPQALAVLQTMADQQRLNLDVIVMAFSKAYTSSQVEQLYSDTIRITSGSVAPKLFWMVARRAAPRICWNRTTSN